MSLYEIDDLADSLSLLWATEEPLPPATTLTALRQSAVAAINNFYASNIGYSSRTVGFTLVPSPGEMQGAVSGWANWIFNMAPLPQISQEDALGQVMRLSTLTGHHLKASDRDQGYVGRYHACHCEKQLIADQFFAQPLGQAANIVISREPCEDCWNFFARLELIFGLRVDIWVNNHLALQGRNDALFREWLTIFGEIATGVA